MALYLVQGCKRVAYLPAAAGTHDNCKLLHASLLDGKFRDAACSYAASHASVVAAVAHRSLSHAVQHV